MRIRVKPCDSSKNRVGLGEVTRFVISTRYAGISTAKKVPFPGLDSMVTWPLSTSSARVADIAEANSSTQAMRF